MDSGKLNQWLTLGANLGVLVGIILILIELDQNADLMRAQMTQSRADNLVARYDSIVHSDYWPVIAAKRREAPNDKAWLESLSDVEYERVWFTYLREINDIRNQYYQYEEGYLPERIWNTSSRGQIRRMLGLAVLMNRPCNDDEQFREELNRIAAELSMAQCIDDVWR